MATRVRGLLDVLSSGPWRRAPVLLRRRPGVLAAVAGAGAVLAASVAGVPLFLSSAGSESLAVQAGERCPRDTGVTLGRGFAVAGVPPENFEVDESTESFQVDASEVLALQLTPLAPGERPDDPFAPLGDGVGRSVFWLQGDAALERADGSGVTPVALLARDGALDHVDVIDGSPGPGVWVSDRAARLTGLARGDRAVLARTQVEVPIAGVYRDVAGPLPDDYWCSHADLLLPDGPGGELPPPVVLMDHATLLELYRDLGVPIVNGGWEAPLGRDLTLAEADELVAELSCGAQKKPDLSWCSGVDNSGGRITSHAPVELTTGPMAPSGPPLLTPDSALSFRDAGDFVSRRLGSHLPFVTERSRAIQTSVAGGVVPVAGFAALAGVGLVWASALLWFDRRRREVTLLTVRGVSPAALGVKSVLELVIPLVVGAAAGFALAYALVVWLGPSSLLEPAAIRWAGLGAVAAMLVAALTVGTVVAVRARAHHGRRRRPKWLAFVPWEVAVGGAAWVSYRRLGQWGVPVSEGADVSRVDVVGLLFPVLFLLTGVAVGARLLALGLGPLRRRSERWPAAAFLAVRRVARYRAAAIGLVAASALAAGVLGYAATLTRSLEATLDAKAKTFIGSDVAVRLPHDEEIPTSMSGAATTVDVYRKGRVVADGGPGVNVLAIDPSTFERAAFWDPSFSDTSLGELLDRLAAPPHDGSVPALVVGGGVPDGAEVRIGGAGTIRFAVDRVADVSAFPGMKRGAPTVFVAAAALDDLGAVGANTEAWVRGDREDTLDALSAAGTGYVEDRRFDDVVDRASFLTVSWTFGFMQSLGIAAAVLVVGGLAFYLDARRRGRVLGYAFARRMGLTAGAHRRALLAELAATVVVGCLLGLGLALVGARLAYGRIDPVPDYRPDPLLRPAAVALIVVVAVAVVVSGLAAALAQRRTDRDDPLEVLRAGA
ncbi:MAG: FtsX-like permease family protein [Acidimicrobiales bacterium]